jgi:hypothetical protein
MMLLMSRNSIDFSMLAPFTVKWLNLPQTMNSKIGHLHSLILILIVTLNFIARTLVHFSYGHPITERSSFAKQMNKKLALSVQC